MSEPTKNKFTVGTVAALVVSVGAIAGVWTGLPAHVKDALSLGGQSSSPIDALDQRLKLVEQVLPQVEAIKKSASDLSETMRQRIFDADRAGEDVADLKVRQRDLELKVERLNTLIEILGGRS